MLCTSVPRPEGVQHLLLEAVPTSPVFWHSRHDAMHIALTAAGASGC